MNQCLNHSIMESLGLYIQVPFCASKCTFCNFSSQAAPTSVYEPYIAAIEWEAALFPHLCGCIGLREGFAQLPVDTVYLGGGTPTLLGAGKLKKIFGAIRRHFKMNQVIEITIEMTPGSADDALLEYLLHLGVNRLSIGAQSFDDRELRPVGRLHSAAETVEQVEAARRAGFRNLSLDVIAGLPYQTLESWRKSLQALAWIEPEHVSIYLFEADEKSRLGKEVLQHGRLSHAGELPDEDFMARAYEIACEFLAKEGYEHYEISNFARPGRRSIHNQKYWQRQPYLGLGAGAHSFDGGQRWANEVSPESYQSRVERDELPIVERRAVGPAGEMEEFFFLGLRQREGVSLEQARLRWGNPPLNGWIEKARRLENEGFLKQAEGRLSLTERAYLVSNEIFQEFIC
ncbi:MAG: radical SAM family heme chaperone HemW [Terriglobia bacterium]